MKNVSASPYLFIMALTCEIWSKFMKIDDIYVLYKNGDKFFNSYEEAWKHHYLTGSKKVYYIFTPTMKECKNVSELEHHARVYFNNSFSMDYLNIITGSGFKQQKLF